MASLMQQVQFLQEQLASVCNENATLQKRFTLQNGGYNDGVTRATMPVDYRQEKREAINNQKHDGFGGEYNTQQASSFTARVPENGFVPAVPQMMGAYNAFVQKPYDLPEFSGEPGSWVIFNAAYHQTTEAFGYGPLQNLMRQQKCLKGEARESVRYLLTDPDNVDELLDDLKFRYGRPEQLIESQTAKIYDFKPIDERHIERFIDYSSVVQNAVAYLNKDASRHVLGETTLMKALVVKLPPAKQLQWAEYAMTLNHRATAVDFSVWLKRLQHCRCQQTTPQHRHHHHNATHLNLNDTATRDTTFYASRRQRRQPDAACVTKFTEQSIAPISRN